MYAEHYFDVTRLTLLEDVPSSSDTAPESPQGQVPLPFSFQLSKLQETQLAGGTVKIVDSSIFNISKTIAVAEVTVEPGAIRYFQPTVRWQTLAHIPTESCTGTLPRPSGDFSCEYN